MQNYVLIEETGQPRNQGSTPPLCVHWVAPPGTRPPAAFSPLLLKYGAKPDRPHGGFTLDDAHGINFQNDLQRAGVHTQYVAWHEVKQRIC